MQIAKIWILYKLKSILIIIQATFQNGKQVLFEVIKPCYSFGCLKANFLFFKIGVLKSLVNSQENTCV